MAGLPTKPRATRGTFRDVTGGAEVPTGSQHRERRR